MLKSEEMAIAMYYIGVCPEGLTKRTNSLQSGQPASCPNSEVVSLCRNYRQLEISEEHKLEMPDNHLNTLDGQLRKFWYENR